MDLHQRLLASARQLRFHGRFQTSSISFARNATRLNFAWSSLCAQCCDVILGLTSIPPALRRRLKYRLIGSACRNIDVSRHSFLSRAIWLTN